MVVGASSWKGKSRPSADVVPAQILMMIDVDGKKKKKKKKKTCSFFALLVRVSSPVLPFLLHHYLSSPEYRRSVWHQSEPTVVDGAQHAPYIGGC